MEVSVADVITVTVVGLPKSKTPLEGGSITVKVPIIVQTKLISSGDRLLRYEAAGTPPTARARVRVVDPFTQPASRK